MDFRCLAIQSHPHRGNEILSLLESMGGRDENNVSAKGDWIPVSIDEDGVIFCPVLCKCLTLDEFAEKYPYKVGDKVRHNKWITPLKIEKISLRYGIPDVVYTLKTILGYRLKARISDFRYWKQNK